MSCLCLGVSLIRQSVLALSDATLLIFSESHSLIVPCATLNAPAMRSCVQPLRHVRRA